MTAPRQLAGGPVGRDATFTFAKMDYEGVQPLADEVQAMSLANLFGEYVAVMSTAEGVDLL